MEPGEPGTAPDILTRLPGFQQEWGRVLKYQFSFLRFLAFGWCWGRWCKEKQYLTPGRGMRDSARFH